MGHGRRRAHAEASSNSIVLAMSTAPLTPTAPPPTPRWLGEFCAGLGRRRRSLTRSTQLAHAQQAHQLMFLLDPSEAVELWDDAMLAQVPLWRFL